MNAIQMTAKLYDCRETAKKLAKMQNKNFIDIINPYKVIIEQVKEAKKIETIPALLLISKTESYNENGMTQLLLLAAVCEIMEPEN
jgi:hypothetical protein